MAHNVVARYSGGFKVSVCNQGAWWTNKVLAAATGMGDVMASIIGSTTGSPACEKDHAQAQVPPRTGAIWRPCSCITPLAVMRVRRVANCQTQLLTAATDKNRVTPNVVICSADSLCL